jgi:hypothetical protein
MITILTVGKDDEQIEKQTGEQPSDHSVGDKFHLADFGW